MAEYVVIHNHKDVYDLLFEELGIESPTSDQYRKAKAVLDKYRECVLRYHKVT